MEIFETESQRIAPVLGGMVPVGGFPA